jgi:hypothetical protein
MRRPSKLTQSDFSTSWSAIRILDIRFRPRPNTMNWDFRIFIVKRLAANQLVVASTAASAFLQNASGPHLDLISSVVSSAYWMILHRCVDAFVSLT